MENVFLEDETAPWRFFPVANLPSPPSALALFFGVTLLASASFPFSSGNLAQLEALNRELGKLCSVNPPRQALTVCRLHAKLLGAL